MGVSNAHQSYEVAVSRARSPAPIRIIQRIRIIRRRYVSDCTVVTLLDRSAAASEQGGYAMIHILRGRALVHRAASFTASIKAGVFTTRADTPASFLALSRARLLQDGRRGEFGDRLRRPYMSAIPRSRTIKTETQNQSQEDAPERTADDAQYPPSAHKL
jgi:hypothetical protein